MKHQLKGKKIMISILSIAFAIFALTAGRLYFLTTATKGEPIADYGKEKAALIIIDVQEDTLSIPQYSNAKELMQNINDAIKYADENGMDIIYIKQENKNILDIILTGGRYKAKTKGAALSSQLLVRSNNIFSKLKSDAFSEKAFEQYLIEHQINTLYIAGADATACVYKTSLGGVNRGYKVIILKDCIFSINESIRKKMLEKYKANGIDVEIMNDYLQSF